MSLQNQIHLYSVDTSFFYNENEEKIHKRLNKLYKHRSKLKILIKKKKETRKDKINTYISNINRRIKKFKDLLYIEFGKNNNIRSLNSEKLSSYNIVSVFESVLTRTLKISNDSLTTDIFIIQTYFFDVIKDIIINGFLYNGEKYCIFTASAGQIRTKKTVFIKESVLLEHQKSLMCGLTREKINELGGVNINKYLAYLALCNSATDEWINFDIRKSIVVDDMETTIRGIVDFINDKTYEIERKEADITITHTDGCGMILPKLSRKCFMGRLPWIKGLFVPCPYDIFIKENNSNTKIKDIYGKEWDIIEDGIEIIFTKSQFKMYKYYSSWNEYCDNFIKYNCQAGKCNEEGSVSYESKLNYQMLQTLTDITDKELSKLASITNNRIQKITKDKNVMLKVLGVTKGNVNKNYLQQALEIYPNLLRDKYIKNILEQTKKSIIVDGRSAKIDLESSYAFICPDLYAFCEYLFLGEKNPKGLLKNNEVFYNPYKNKYKLDCLRSPHLYREHAVRYNVVDNEKLKWFITNGIYTSIHDLVSKILQFDNDGDCSLVVADELFISIAERNMEDIVPLYYNMSKSGAIYINNQMIYSGLKFAYTGGNIGVISNDITKIWNSDNINLNVIKLLCMENNFTIDYAKTLYKPERPKHIKKLITSYTKAKVPHFFIYAKDKKESEVEKVNNSVVNRLEKIIKNNRMAFSTAGIGKFDYKMLDRYENVNVDDKIIKLYEELDEKRYFTINSKRGEENYRYIYKSIREKLLESNPDIFYLVSVLVEYLYNTKNNIIKTTLWECFGDVLVENLKYNIKNKYDYCEVCGIIIEKSSNSRKYCSDCTKEIRKTQVRENVSNYRERQKCNQVENL